MDYRKIMGVEALSSMSGEGAGVKIGILDTGVPPNLLHCTRGKSDEDDFCSIPDLHGHATEVSSIIFGAGSITGICERAEPYFYRVIEENGKGTTKSVVKGIYEALEDDVDILNLSLGLFRTENCPESLEKACFEAFEAGKTLICAAGNDGLSVNWPAALKTTICVGSSCENGLKTAFSSFGEVDFVVPGVNLTVINHNGELKTVSGTSFSAAIVTGIAATLVNDIKKKHGRCDCELVRDALKALATDVNDPGWDEDTGYGMIMGPFTDPTVNIKTDNGFFGRMMSWLRSIFGFAAKRR